MQKRKFDVDNNNNNNYYYYYYYYYNTSALDFFLNDYMLLQVHYDK